MRLTSRVGAVERRLAFRGRCGCGPLVVDTTNGQTVPKDTTCEVCGRPKLIIIVEYETKPPLARAGGA